MELKRLKKISDLWWEFPQDPQMRVPARILASQKLLEEMDEKVFEQTRNVATLPGVVSPVLCMPDGHSGYGFPIGGVAAIDIEKEGVISPGGIGFDINCGMRLVLTNLTEQDVRPRLTRLVDELFETIPAGVGRGGTIKLSQTEFKDLMKKGARFAVERGWGWQEDLDHIEEKGELEGADPDAVSRKAIERGINQIGTLGSGNHYLEVQLVNPRQIHDRELASKLGVIGENQITVMIHTGSRGFGHQVATDYLKTFIEKMPKYGISVPDRQLACAPFKSQEGQNYFTAMKAAANAAFANRQVITHFVRNAFEKIFKKSARELEMKIVFDVVHNIAKIEEYEVKGAKKQLLIHRKGATRAFGPGNPTLSHNFQKTGQPVIIGGSMETGSWLLVGTKEAEKLTFGSTAHGAGRLMSRAEAKRKVRGDKLFQEMKTRGIEIRSPSMIGLAEEAGLAYKNVDEVVEIIHQAGISKKVAALKPIGNIKG